MRVLKIPNYSNYEIYPDEGKIFSLKLNRFIGHQRKNLYWQCTIRDDGGKKLNTYVHRLVWIAVNGEIPEGMQVNHIDENPDNNSISNLNLLTPKENCNWGTHNEKIKHSLKGRKFSPESIEKMKSTKRKIVGAFKNGVLQFSFPIKDAMRLGYSQNLIKMFINGVVKEYRGFEWKYLS